MYNHFCLCTSLFMRDTVVPRLRDTRDLIRGHIPSGACGIQSCADLSCPVQACDRPRCQRHTTQLLVELHLDGLTWVGGFVFPRKNQPTSQIEVLVEFAADGRVLGGRSARIFLGFLSCVLLGTTLVTVVSKSCVWSSQR